MLLRGKSISPGVVRGIAQVRSAPTIIAGALQVLPTGSPQVEVERLNAAVARAGVQLERLGRQLHGRIPSTDLEIFTAHGDLLRDRGFLRQIRDEIEIGGRSADAAVAFLVRRIYTELRDSDLPLAQDKATDVLDIGRRLVLCLSATGAHDEELGPDAIVVAHALTPSEVVRFAHQGAVGFITESCGPKSHTAILARGLALPLIAQLPEVTEQIPHRAEIILDGGSGLAYVNPTEEEQRESGQRLARRPRPSVPAHRTPVTQDGVRVALQLNVSDPTEASAVQQLAADGIGLFRTEFLYMDRDWWPSEEESYEIYAEVARRTGAAELHVRLVDFGAEKCPPYADIPLNRNPSLGLRGVRLLLQRDDILRPQVRALARLGRERPLTVLIPMLDTLDTLEAVTTTLCRMCGAADRARLPFRLGTMIEIPSAAYMVEHIVPHVDSLSIGLNDLTQYMLAADRDDEFVEQYHDALQPSVLHVLTRVIRAARERGKPVTICGELAGDPRLTALLVGLGAERLSVSQSSYDAVLCAIQEMTCATARQAAVQILDLPTGAAVRAHIAAHFGSAPNHGAA